MVPDPDWWRADPEHRELLAFDGGTDDQGLPYDAAAADRRAVLEALLGEDGPPARHDPGLPLYLLEQEALWHRHSWGFGHGIGMAALLVAEHRRARDVWPLWDAKTTSFDTMLGLPRELLFAAGVGETVAFVGAGGDPRRADFLGFFEDHGLPDDDEVARTLAGLRRHYTSGG
ncbi:hypothetical protein [Actinomadura rugatobispora]|uniref:DUF4240 domain-containing protein n=1 Tax=Actinomadura rugatobispora TaxID=1994 RepID=A0ABW0ZZB4_9ACTN|nr:hypothetical protein GCM10010200_085820 [Actinomadura rugatobispora]